MNAIALLYRTGFALVCTALLLFAFGEVIPGSSELKSTLSIWTAVVGSLLLIAAGVADAFRRQGPSGGPC